MKTPLLLAALLLSLSAFTQASSSDCTDNLVHSVYATHGLSGASVPDSVNNAVVVVIRPSSSADLRTRWREREAKIKICQYGNCYRKQVTLQMPPVTGYPFNEPVFYMRRDQLPTSPGWMTVEIREVLMGFGEDGMPIAKGCPIQSYVLPL